MTYTGLYNRGDDYWEYINGGEGGEKKLDRGIKLLQSYH